MIEKLTVLIFHLLNYKQVWCSSFGLSAFSLFFSVHQEKKSYNSSLLPPSPFPKKLIQVNSLLFWETSPDITNPTPAWTKWGAILWDVLSQLLLENRVCSPVPNSMCSNSRWVAWNLPRWENLHGGNRQMLQIQVSSQPRAPAVKRLSAHRCLCSLKPVLVPLFSFCHLVL